MSRFKALGHFVYEKGDRIGVTPPEAAVELARKLNAYQMRVERLKTEVERLTKAGDLLAVHYTALSKCVTQNDAKSGSINDWTSVIDWNAAKEGKGQP